MPQPLILQVDLNDKSGPKIKQLNTNLNNIEQHAKGADKGINMLGKGLGRIGGIAGGVVRSLFSMKGAIAALGLGYIAKGAVDTASKFDQMRVALDTITKGKGAETFEALNRWALKMPVNTERAIEAFTKMKAMGLSPTIDEMTVLVDTTAALGGTPDIMDSIAMALGKISAKGKASARDILMFTERGVPAIEILKEELNDTSLSFENIATSGHNADKIIQAMLTGMQKRFGGLSKDIQDRWMGLVETAKSWWKEFIRMVMDQGVLRYLEEKLKTLTDKIDEMAKSGVLKQWAKSTGDWIKNALENIFSAGRKVVDNWDKITLAFKLAGIAVSAFLAYQVSAALTEISIGAMAAAKSVMHLKTTLTALNAAVTGLSIGAKGGLVGLALFGGVALGTYLRKQFAIVNDFGVAFVAGIHKIINSVSYAFQVAWEGFKIGAGYVSNAIASSVSFVLESIENGVRWLGESIVTLIDKLKKIPGASKLMPEWMSGFGGLDISFGRLETKGLFTVEKGMSKINQLTEEFKKKNTEIDQQATELMSDYLGLGDALEQNVKHQKTAKQTIEETIPELESVKKGTEEINKEAEQFKELWKKANETIRDGFLTNFADAMTGSVRSFKDFTNNIKSIWRSEIAKLASIKFLKPLADGLTEVMMSPFKSILGSGISGGLSGQAGDKGTGGGLLGTIGGAMPIIGGAAYIAGTLMSQKKQEPQIVELSYDIDQDKFKQVTDLWTGGAEKNTELIAQVDTTIQSMIDMYSNLSEFANKDLKNMSVTVESLGNIWGELMREIRNIPVQFAIQYEDVLKNIFGEAYSGDIAKQISEMEAQMKQLTMGFSEEYVAHSVIFAEWRKQAVVDLREQINSLMDEFEDQITGLYDTFTKFGEDFSEIIGNAFSDALGTGGFSQFKSELGKNIYSLFRTQLIENFLTDFATEAMRSIWDLYGVEGFSGLVTDVISGDKGADDVSSVIETMVGSIETLEPIFTAFNESLMQIDEALDYNTEAIESNTDVLTAQQQIQDFIRELTVGTLAPAQSVEAITGEYEKLLGGENLNDLFSFITGTMLPFFQTYGGNYQEVFSGVVSDLQSLSSVYGSGINPAAIGDAVAGAILPALSSGQPINLTIELDGNVLGTALIDQLDSNGELVIKLNETLQ